MSYQQADRISQSNKEFIRSLFPQDPLYMCLLPAPVRQLIGTVGTETKSVEKMLRAIGFQYAKRIDPFDGGPHFVAKVSEISLLKLLGRARLGEGEPAANAPWGIVAVERSATPRFGACGARHTLEGGIVRLPAGVVGALGVGP